MLFKKILKFVKNLGFWHQVKNQPWNEVIMPWDCWGKPNFQSVLLAFLDSYKWYIWRKYLYHYYAGNHLSPLSAWNYLCVLDRLRCQIRCWMRYWNEIWEIDTLCGKGNECWDKSYKLSVIIINQVLLPLI